MCFSFVIHWRHFLKEVPLCSDEGPGDERKYGYREIDYEELVFGKKIGAGAFGAVYKVFRIFVFAFGQPIDGSFRAHGEERLLRSRD